MPTTIDIENAKQIRQPMDVLITMQVPDDDISLTFSGYSSTAKVADGVLAQKSWPMRTLADLQGDGFALNGSAVLYDPSTSASQANGKLGVRGNVGQPVDLTVTGDQMITGLTLLVTGAESVTYNGGTHAVSAGRVSFLVGATSASLTLTPSAEDTRIQVSFVETGSEIRITNENLISCIVSLRSDLSPFDQTLPESELNIEAYDDVDISAAVANIPDDTPIIYTAGYDNNMSPVRNFYVSGQITWADNILSIHAVDAVHFLDNLEVAAPIATEHLQASSVSFARYMLNRAGIDYKYQSMGQYAVNLAMIQPGISFRDYMASLNQFFNLTDRDGNLLDGSGKLRGAVQFAFVDAGKPEIRSERYSADFDIQESDCADVNRHIEVQVTSVSGEWDQITNPEIIKNSSIFNSQKVGSATFIKGVGTSISIEQPSFRWVVGLYLGEDIDNDVSKKLLAKYGTVYAYGKVMPAIPCESDGYSVGRNVGIRNPLVGDKLLYGSVPQEEYREYPEQTTTGDTVFSSFVPWTQSYDGWRYDNNPGHLIRTAAQMWNVLASAGVIDKSAETIELDIFGNALNFNPQKLTYTRNNAKGKNYDFGKLPFSGRIMAQNSNRESVDVYPQKSMMVGMYRSPVTGSFTWKGDPRMQPRDVVNFHRLDGTVEEITIETITLKHEGGGTTAEITYRKGVV